MAKKRQQDFNKTQIKPGRTVAKRRNITSTTFKAKKITVLNKGSKQNASAKTIPDCLKIIKGSSHVAARTCALNDLDKLIANNKDALIPNLNDVLESVLKLFLDGDDNLRDAATRVLDNILQCTNDLQIQSFVPHFINVLSCAMTHANMRVKEHSLKLLKPMIKLHPNLFSHSMTLVNHLLQMLIGSPRTRTHSQTPKQPVSVMYSDGIYSPCWRIHLLGHINVFLKSMLANYSVVMKNDNDTDEQEVYWNSKSPLHLEIYAGSGLKPFDIEKSYSNCISSEELCDDSKILVLIENILQIFPSVFTEEMASLPKSDDNLVDGWTISSLSILFQVLTTISEWLKLLSCEDMDKIIGDFLKDCMYEKRRFPIRKRGAVFGRAEEDFDCVELNLSICFLYCTYLFESVKNKEDLYDSVFSYVQDVFTMSNEVKYKSIPLLVKIMQIFFPMWEITEVSDFLCDGLCHLCSLLKISDDRPNRNLLTSLFTKMSLDSAYHFVAETDAMKDWFKWLLYTVTEIPKTGNIDKKLLSVIKKIANRRYPCFQKLFMHIDFSAIKAMLKYNDDDVRDAAIFLIYNMKDISSNVLDIIARVILTESAFPMKFAVRLLRLITYRFSEKSEKQYPEASIYSPRGLVDIIQFLLNVGIDSFNINNDKFINFEANEYTRSLKIIKDACSYDILPSLHWKEHSVLFEICSRFLDQLPQNVVTRITVDLFTEILDNCRVLPMHVVISILKLNKLEQAEKYHRIQVYDLIFSSLLTTSVLTAGPIDDDWYECNVTELTNSIEFNNQLVLETLTQLQFLRDIKLEGIAVYHMLRICRVYLHRKLLDEENSEMMIRTLEVLKDKCSDKTIDQQPLFNYLYNHLYV